MSNESTFTSGQLAKRFGVSVSSIKNWTQDGTLANVGKTAGGHRRYTQAHVDILTRIMNPTPATPDAQPAAPSAEVKDATAS